MKKMGKISNVSFLLEDFQYVFVHQKYFQKYFWLKYFDFPFSLIFTDLAPFQIEIFKKKFSNVTKKEKTL